MGKVNQPFFWLWYHLGMLIFSLSFASIIKYNQSGTIFVPETILAAAINFFTCIFTGYLALYFVNKGKKLSHAELTKRIIPAFLIFIVLVTLMANLIVSLGVLGWYLYKHWDMSGFLTNLFTKELIFANKNLVVWLLLFSVVFFSVLWKRSSQKEVKLQEENLRYRYRTLKSQINPHFLFNSLNTLSELVYEDAGRADRYIQKLSGIYRYILDNEEKEFIPISQEVEFVKDYFELQKERVGNKIELSFQLEDMGDCMILPVSLQLLVENAIKHNAFSTEMPLKISISGNDEYLVVSNNIQRKNIMEETTKMGLQNLKERAVLITGRELISEEKNNTFTVHLPVIRKIK